MSEIAYRRPRTDEAELLCTSARQLITTSFSTFPPAAIKEYLAPWGRKRVISRLEHGNDVLIAALADDDVIGVVSGTAPEGGVGTVVWLLVDERWRGLKVGRGLYEAACNAYRELGAHKMKLTAPSEEARQFYESCGMRVEGLHPCHWYKMSFFSLGVILCTNQGADAALTG
jgi:GNAT superfamily N-acetyltransferase